MKAWLKEFLTGLSIRQEYICIGDKLSDSLRVFLTYQNTLECLEVTEGHIFLGYKPLVIAIVFSGDESTTEDMEICLSLNKSELSINSQWKGFHADRTSIARLHLKPIKFTRLTTHRVVFYEGVSGRHRFISVLHQRVNTFLMNFKTKSVGNVFLNGNLYDQTRIAYAIARRISLMTVSDGSLFNLFPTDLHGAVGEDYYISSLRLDGEACKQVEQYRKVVISDIEATQFQIAYQLGKNHMMKMRPRENFDWLGEFTKVFNFPLPQGTGFYRELELTQSFDVGIHRLFFFKVVNTKKLKDSSPLAHIHQYYAQWRINEGFKTQWLLR